MRMNREIDVRHVLPTVRVPTLILSKTSWLALASASPTAVYTPLRVSPASGACLLSRGRESSRLQSGAGWVELPTALARKCPNAGREWVW